MKIPVMRTNFFTCYKNAGCMTFLYFVSGKLAMSTLKDYALLVKLFYKNNAFSPLALKKFRIFNGMKKEIHPMLV